MKKVLVFSCVIIVLGILLGGSVSAQNLEDMKAQARAQVRREMGLDSPQTPQQRYVQQQDVAPARTRLELIQQVVLILILLAFIPATVAKIKGRSFIAWWVLGLLCFIIVFPAAVYMKKLPGASGVEPKGEPKKGFLKKTDVYDKIENLSKLKEKGILSSDEFEDKKRELLARI